MLSQPRRRSLPDIQPKPGNKPAAKPTGKKAGKRRVSFDEGVDLAGGTGIVPRRRDATPTPTPSQAPPAPGSEVPTAVQSGGLQPVQVISLSLSLCLFVSMCACVKLCTVGARAYGVCGCGCLSMPHSGGTRNINKYKKNNM